MVRFHSFSWLSNIPLCAWNASSLSIHLLIDRLLPYLGYCKWSCLLFTVMNKYIYLSPLHVCVHDHSSFCNCLNFQRLEVCNVHSSCNAKLWLVFNFSVSVQNDKVSQLAFFFLYFIKRKRGWGVFLHGLNLVKKKKQMKSQILFCSRKEKLTSSLK